MHKPLPQIRLAELLGALSHALDLTEGQPRGHCIRCCWIGTQVGLKLKLWPDDLSELYYTLLLKDLGCSSNAARICQLYLADDIGFKRDFKLIDGSLPQALRFVLGHTGLEAGLAERFRAIIGILKNGGQISRELIEARCHRGAEIAARMRFSKTVCDAIQNLDEHWDGSGKPEGLAGKTIPLFSQIALLAQVVDVFNVSNGPAAAVREIRNREGTWFDPLIVEAFSELQSEPDFWEILQEEDLPAVVLHLEPAKAKRWVDEDYLDEIATAFAQVIDAKSSFTRGHSERVAIFTDMIAEEMGFSPARRRWLGRGALLHDIGKLAISSSILDKNGKLTDQEFAVIKSHPVHSENILASISVFADLAPVAGGHHERLDGKGYPRGLKGDQINLETRIVTTADIFDALTADRPYRAAMPVSRAYAIMTKDLGTAIDPACFAALQAALARAEAAEAA
ncbi:HD-GYP domain-containing protein [Aestuariivirga sp.]|uniref:HD-GYP domain-containing protein n=1 Tax=Aestuariivirga sp. TaxID=2650926 RepID=UPI0035933748